MNELADIRRTNLRAIIDREGLAVAARRFQKPDRQLNDMLAGRKSFGEKVARAMERNYDPAMPPGWLDLPPDSALPLPAPKPGTDDNAPIQAAAELWRSYLRADAEAQRVVDIVLDRERGEIGATLKSAITTALLAAKREPSARTKTA